MIEYPAATVSVASIPPDEQITALQDRISVLNEHIRDLREQWMKDIDTISDHLIAEANDREWCSVYDSFIADLNGRLHYPLKDRMCDYTVVQTYTVTRSKTVSAISEEHAQELVDRAWDWEDLEDGDWVVDNFESAGSYAEKED